MGRNLELKPFVPIIIVCFLITGGFVTATAPINKPIIKNQPPGQPIIIGETEGKVGLSYTYKFNAEDPDGDNISYYVDWGDGMKSGWTNYYGSGEDIAIKHSWDKIDRYPIRCKAKDVYGVEGDWSTQEVIMFKSKNPMWWLYSLLDRFPLLSRLLDVLGWLM